MFNSLKGVSSRRYGQAGHPIPYEKDANWSHSYLVSTVGGAPLAVLRRYIKDQEKPAYNDQVLTQIFDKLVAFSILHHIDSLDVMDLHHILTALGIIFKKWI